MADNMTELRGLDSLARARTHAGRARLALGRTGRLHRRMGRVLRRWIDRNFRTQGALLAEMPGGWPPLAPATRAERRRRGIPGAPPLDVTGRLRRGITVETTEQRIVADNPVPYAARHQRGRGVPRRPFLPGPAQARALVYPELERHVREAVS